MKFTFSKLFLFIFLLILLTIVSTAIFYCGRFILSLLVDSSRVLYIYQIIAIIFYILLLLLLFFYIFDVVQFKIKTVLLLFFFMNVVALFGIFLFFYFGDILCKDIIDVIENEPSFWEKVVSSGILIIFVVFLFFRLNKFEFNYWDILHFISLLCILLIFPSINSQITFLIFYIIFMATRYIHTTNNKGLPNPFKKKNKEFMLLMYGIFIILYPFIRSGIAIYQQEKTQGLSHTWSIIKSNLLNGSFISSNLMYFFLGAILLFYYNKSVSKYDMQ
jgi:hypothetical protein